MTRNIPSYNNLIEAGIQEPNEILDIKYITVI